ncbi:DUF2920 family protein [Paenibacillus sp. HWE-109]|uniref:DUF2920 family protein n=1 Tax=Paenibacillus sp. HWE-109 TaxID=1306526 RepID=UPI001EDE6D34|nr:DUF2920 family protein [Paenibacillus sp. HWE-109]UKS26897.1 DUF2920 family protein [Paenibacillus sp. HWE-109]
MDMTNESKVNRRADSLMLNNRFFTRPHPDIELGYKRSILEYVLTFPKGGINSDTGLIFVITPFGDSPDSVYQAEKLRPFLAEKYNCIVASVIYFGMDRSFNSVSFDYQFLDLLQAKYAIPYTEFLNENGSIKEDSFTILASHLKMKGIRFLTESRPYMQTVYHQKGEYQSFGFLPALDCLVVLGDILKKYPINKKKIIAYGSSYGGYIALLLGKFAPQTFSVIIDNSGYSRASLHNVCTKDFNTGSQIYNDGNVIISGVSEEPWTLVNENDPCYFSDSCRSIRSLLEEKHRVASDTAYFIFHGDNDQICPTKDKEEVVKILEKYNPIYFKKVTESDLDGVVFKNMNHGMDASLRGLFERVYTLDNQNLLKNTESTDFENENVYHFDCGNKIYQMSFSKDYQVKSQILDR